MSLKINEKISVGRASALLAGLIFLSRVMGFARTQMTSYFYGTGPQADAFNAAFAIPELISIVIAGGALATGFVPTFSAFLAQNEHEKAKKTFASLLSILFLAVGFLTLVLVGLTFTPLVNWLAPEPQTTLIYAENLRLLLLAQAFFILGGVFTGAFNSLRHFWLPALQPVFFNLGILAFGLFGALGEKGIIWQSYGAIFGALVGSVALQIPFALRAGLPVKFRLDFADEGVQKVLRSLLPVFFGLASGRILALSLPVALAADSTVLTNATRLSILPLELIASGSAIAIFPTLSLLGAQGKLGEVRAQLWAVLRRVMKLILIATAGLIVLAFPLVRILFQYGQFSASDATFTAQILMLASLCLPGLAAQQLLARGFFALGDTKTPAIAGAISMALFGVLCAIFWSMGTFGVTLASVVSVSVLALLLWRGLSRKLPQNSA
mgnify:CR=1 FL=1